MTHLWTAQRNTSPFSSIIGRFQYDATSSEGNDLTANILTQAQDTSTLEPFRFRNFLDPFYVDDKSSLAASILKNIGDVRRNAQDIWYIRPAIAWT